MTSCSGRRAPRLNRVSWAGDEGSEGAVFVQRPGDFGPATRLADTPRPLKIEAGLVGALLGDIEAGGAKDALPLLSFTLERLYLENRGVAGLTVADYRALGGIAGSIEEAVERALEMADADPTIPSDRAARLALLPCRRYRPRPSGARRD